MEAKIEKTYLTVPHGKGNIAFQDSSFNGTHGNVAEQIDKAELKRPTSPETASLIYDFFQNKEGKYGLEMIKIIKDGWILEFTGNLNLPKSNEEINNGVIIEYNPKITNRKLVMNKNSLIKRLQENDPLVKFVPFGYKINEQTQKEFGKNPYIREMYGKEGAEKITEVASKYKNKPYIYSFDSVDEEKTRMSALYGSWLFDFRLVVFSDCWNNNVNGHAFGVCPREKKESLICSSSKL